MSEFMFGVSEVDITPNIGLPMAGYSTGGKVSVGVNGHLFARAFYLEDGMGERVAVCVADLHSGTRYLHERAAERTRASCGLGVDRLVLCGTHTHTAPGNIYGNSLYDTFSQTKAGLDVALADWLASRIALAVQRAAAVKQPAFTGFARRPLWGPTRNRSLPAFENNAEAARWNDPGRPGEGAPGDLPDLRFARVDPRISVLAGFGKTDGRVLGALAVFGCHTTTTGPDTDCYHPDWAGHAARTARRELERPGEGERIVVAVALGGAGDVNGLRDHLDPPWRQGRQLSGALGLQVGVGIARAARAARDRPTGAELRALYAEPATKDGATYPDRDARLAREWMIGASTLAGAEDGRTGFYPDLAREGMTGDTAEPHRPKAEAGGPLQDIVRELSDLEPGPVVPMHALRIGSARFVTVPGEPTAHAAFDIERAVLVQTGAESVTVLGYAGDYMGYFPTAAEYELQHYEGASAIFGRHSARHIQARLRDLLRAGVSGPMRSRPIEFDGPRRKSRFTAPEDLSCEDVDPRPRIRRERNFVHVRWRMATNDLIPFALGSLIRVEVEDGSGWTPLRHMGRDFDDVHAFIHVERAGTFAPGVGTARWHARFGLPAGAGGKAPLRVRVSRCGEFPGFAIEIPASA